MRAQSSFSDRISRIEAGKTFGDMAVCKSGNQVQSGKPRRSVHWDILALGGIAGAVAGILFATNVGLFFLVTLNLTALYQIVMTDYLTAGYIAGVAIAPVGFVLSRIFSNTNKRAWQLWIGYLVGVLAANYSDLESYYFILTAPAV